MRGNVVTEHGNALQNHPHALSFHALCWPTLILSTVPSFQWTLPLSTSLVAAGTWAVSPAHINVFVPWKMPNTSQAGMEMRGVAFWAWNKWKTHTHVWRFMLHFFHFPSPNYDVFKWTGKQRAVDLGPQKNPRSKYRKRVETCVTSFCLCSQIL